MKQVEIRWTTFIIIPCALAFLAWASASIVLMIKSTEAISTTTLLCADRLINEVEHKKALEDNNETLTRENLFLRGRISSLEELYGLSKTSYEQSRGIGGTPD